MIPLHEAIKLAKRHRIVQLIMLVLLLTLNCPGQTEEKKNWRTDPYATQLDMNEGARGDFDKADAKLNKLYQLARARHKGESLFLQKFQKAQQAWLAFRDAHMEARYPAADKRAEYGSVYSMCHWTEMAELTEARNKQLEKWAYGVVEGDVCGGSYGHKTR